jgi:hypothetical protein
MASRNSFNLSGENLIKLEKAPNITPSIWNQYSLYSGKHLPLDGVNIGIMFPGINENEYPLV